MDFDDFFNEANLLLLKHCLAGKAAKAVMDFSKEMAEIFPFKNDKKYLNIVTRYDVLSGH